MEKGNSLSDGIQIGLNRGSEIVSNHADTIKKARIVIVIIVILFLLTQIL